MRFYYIVISALVVLTSLTIKRPYHHFLKKYVFQYKSENKLRPNDSLYYITEVMNIYDEQQSKLIKDHYKFRFFGILARKKPYIVYRSAIDTISGAYYINTRGDLDYWEKKRKKVKMTKVDYSLLHENVRHTIELLVDYVKDAKPDYIFTISGYDEVDYQVYWAIKDSSLRVIRIERYGGEMIEYDAEYYVNTIAPDSFFSASKRWDEYLIK